MPNRCWISCIYCKLIVKLRTRRYNFYRSQLSIWLISHDSERFTDKSDNNLHSENDSSLGSFRRAVVLSQNRSLLDFLKKKRQVHNSVIAHNINLIRYLVKCTLGLGDKLWRLLRPHTEELSLKRYEIL